MYFIFKQVNSLNYVNIFVFTKKKGVLFNVFNHSVDKAICNLTQISWSCIWSLSCIVRDPDLCNTEVLMLI